MTSDIPFLHRPDWIQNGEPRYDTMCPVSAAKRLKRLSVSERRGLAAERREGEGGASEGNQSRPLSALEQRYDWELHQMVA